MGEAARIRHPEGTHPGRWVASLPVDAVARDACDLLAPADQTSAGSSTCGMETLRPPTATITT
jgi:hypothetical protein